jgi:hypothetical protein
MRLLLLLWDLGEKTTACRKQRFNHLGPQMVWQRQDTWALQVEFSSSILHGVCDIIFELSNDLHGNEKELIRMIIVAMTIKKITYDNKKK